MTRLPPLTEGFESYADVFAAARRRWTAAWKADANDGCMDAPFCEFGSIPVLLLWGLAILLVIATVVTVFFTRGPVLLGLAAVTVADVVFVWRRLGRNAAEIRKRRRESVVTTGGVVMANNDLFDADSTDAQWGVVLFTFDDALAADGEALADLTERAYREWRQAKPDDLPADLREAALFVCQDTPIRDRTPVPESWAGHPGVWLASVYFERDALPGKFLNRRVMPFIVHPNETYDSVEVLPAHFWWREDVDDLTRAFS